MRLIDMNEIIQQAHLPIHKIQMPADYGVYTLTVTGGKGGDVSTDITLNHANAIKILANVLLVAIRQRDIKLYIVHMNGGHDAITIPGHAEAKVVIPKDDEEKFVELLQQANYAVTQQFAETDPEVVMMLERSVWNSSILSEESTHLLLATINGVPVGPQAWSEDDSQEMLTSNNIGFVRQGRATIDVGMQTRSYDVNAMNNLAGQIKHIFVVSGAEVESQMG